MASTSNQPFVFKYGGTDIQFHDAVAVFGDDIPPEEHIQLMLKLIEKMVKRVMKFVKDAESRGIKLPEKNERGQQAIYYGEKTYKTVLANFEQEDNEKVRIENLGPTVDYDALAETLQEYYAVIEGYHEDKYQLSDAQFFHVMKMCLENISMRNKNSQKPNVSPDALYYAFYKTFPLTGSQRRMSMIFPKLVEEYGSKGDFSLESWKKEKHEKEERHCFSERNHFRTCLPYKKTNKLEHYCRVGCYNRIQLSEEIIEDIPNFNNNFFLAWIPKKLRVSPRYAGFLDALFGAKHTETKPVDFCKIAGKYYQETNRTCEELYQFVIDLNSIRFTRPPVAFLEKSYQERRFEFDEVRRECQHIMDKKIDDEMLEKIEDEEEDIERKMTDEENKIFCEKVREKMKNDEPLCKPCSHFGPCGPDQDNCSCEKWCTEQCGCDMNCPRRFPGCQCPPGRCRDDDTDGDLNGKGRPVACLCVAEWRECIPGLCNGCLEHENKSCAPKNQKCNNVIFRRGVVCKVEAGQSKIAGTGGFAKEDIVKGECFGEYVGAHVSHSEAERRDRLFLFGISYVYHLPCNFGCIDSAFFGNATRFLNHDNNPNCESTFRIINGKPRLGFVALQDVKAGTELFFNYGYDEKGAKQMFQEKPEQRAPQLQRASSSNNYATPIVRRTRMSQSFRASSIRKRQRESSDESGDENAEDPSPRQFVVPRRRSPLFR